MMEVKSEYKMTEIGKIPVDWKLKKLEEVTTIVSGGTPSKENNKYWNNGDILWATPTDITKNKSKYINDTKMKISEQGLNESSASLLPEGSVLMTSRATIGEKSINLKPMATNQGFKSFICKNSLFNEYLYYYIEILKPLFLSKSSGSTFLELSKKSTEDQLIALPPLKEQQKIAEILSTVDEQIEQTDQLIEKTTELRKGLMQQLLTKGIGHTKFKKTELGEIPNDWNVATISDLITTIDGDRGKNYPNPDSFEKEGYCLFLDTGNVRKMGFNFERTKFISKERHQKLRSGTLERGDIVLTTRGTIGNVALYDESVQHEVVRINSAMLILRNKSDYLDYNYFIHFLRGKTIENFIRKARVGSAQPHITKSSLNKEKIVVPSIKEQQKIAEILSAIDEEIEGYEEEKAKYEELKKGLMQQLLTGKKRVKV